ncbi:DUF5995 family protein [Nocardia crassostreae]|uniref:DUF5995 family protein n=1 Tax=Nocardia crassostreae TaxID=53428 RepID=UPI00082D6788|nr:DUF5995 family protein [Nocardia crassostreae]
MWTPTRTGLLLVVGAALLALSAPAPRAASLSGQPPAPAVCGTPLSSDEIATIARLSDTSDLPGNSLARLELAVQRNQRITRILAEHRDRRGLFGIGLDGVEEVAVMPLQRDPLAFADREFAHAISFELLRRYLDNLHAEFTGGAVESHWARYFALAARCELSGARVAMSGYNAHLTVDLAYSIAAIGTKPHNAPDYFTIVAAIAGAGEVIVDRTKRVYDADLGPLWRFYFLGEGLDLLVGRGVATRQLLIAADLGANVVIFGNGLALQDPALREATALEITALSDSAEVAFEVLAQLRAL